MKPLFVHDCDVCKYLGSDTEYDYYYCVQGPGPTVIARYGSDGPDYTSGMELAKFDPRLAEAKRRAIAAGYLT